MAIDVVESGTEDFDAVRIYHKMAGCLVPNTVAIYVPVQFVEKGYITKHNKISFKEQCEFNCFTYRGENPEIEF